LSQLFSNRPTSYYYNIIFTYLLQQRGPTTFDLRAILQKLTTRAPLPKKWCRL